MVIKPDEIIKSDDDVDSNKKFSPVFSFFDDFIELKCCLETQNNF